MYGFAGIVFAGSDRSGPHVLARMAERVRHRGPDGEHEWLRDDAALVHCRLSVIDLSARADQPLERGDLDAVIAYNGEIYNYRELRHDLRERGVIFATESDTEVLLAGLALDGVATLQRLRGMFSLALWRPRQRTLLLARDPLGKKPLFWSRRGDGAVVFGSTPGAIIAGLGATPDVRRDAISAYLHHLVIPQETCIYEGVERVPPGGWIRLGSGGEIDEGRFWSQPEGADWLGDSVELAEEIERRLRTAVRRRLISDVPVGAFLSAGKDSGLVVALAAQEAGEPIRTFTAGTLGSLDDERADARLVATRYSTMHTEVEVPPLSAADLPRLLWEAGEPFADASIQPSAAVAAAARRHVKVTLTGDGGDELFFGYRMFRGVQAGERLRRVVPRPILRGLRPLTNGAQGRGWRNAADALLQYATDGFTNRMGWGPADRKRLLSSAESSTPESLYSSRLRHWEGLGAADALRRTLLETWLPDDYLTKVDVATMAVALEARSPFLDLDLVELLLSVPASVAFPDSRPKVLLAPLAAKYLPPPLRTRKKSGFGIPIREWLLGPLRESYRRHVVRPGRIMHEWIDPVAAAEAYVELEHGSVRADRVWALLVLGVWAAVALDGDLAPDELLVEAA
jgi:asparagine synthase (glutamine-hydrolysing)